MYFKVLNSFKASIPTIEEQIKIATFLSAVDEKIAQLSCKHELLQQYKQGMMQQLFSQKLRFKDDKGEDFPEWNEKCILDLATISIGLVTTMTENYREKGVPLIRNSDICANSIKKEKLIFLDPIFAGKYIDRTLKYKDIVTVHTGNVGISSVIPKDLDGALGFATINTRIKSSELSPYYLAWYFNSFKFLQWCLNKSTGDGRQNLNLKDFNSATIPVPSFREQIKIANYLNAIDNKINVVTNQLQQAREWKQGLLQQMFV